MSTILYLSRLAFTSEKANVYNTVRTCIALGQAGAKVILVSTHDAASTPETLMRFRKKYDIPGALEILSLTGASNSYGFGSAKENSKLAAVLANIELMRAAWRYRSADVVYLRDQQLLPAALFASWILRKPVFFEAHAVLVGARNKFLGDMLARHSRGIIAITHALADYFRQINADVIVSYCAAGEPERFAKITDSKEALRTKLALPQEAYILCYTGNLGMTGNNDSYGIEDIVAAMPFMPQDVIFVGVGKKSAEETASHEELAKRLGVGERVRFLPWTSKDTVAEYLRAADILLIPAAGARIGNAPSKIFDYMISGRPIIAADTIPMHDALTERKTALLVEYKRPEAWAQAVGEIRSDSTLSASLVAQAQKEGMTYTWQKRGSDILEFLSGRANSVSRYFFDLPHISCNLSGTYGAKISIRPESYWRYCLLVLR